MKREDYKIEGFNGKYKIYVKRIYKFLWHSKIVWDECGPYGIGTTLSLDGHYNGYTHGDPLKPFNNLADAVEQIDIFVKGKIDYDSNGIDLKLIGEDNDDSCTDVNWWAAILFIILTLGFLFSFGFIIEYVHF